MVKLTDSLSERMVKPIDLRRATESPLERALRDAGIKGTAGGAIAQATRSHDRIGSLHEETGFISDRIRSPYRSELDQLGSAVRHRRTSTESIVSSSAQPAEEINSVAQIGLRVREARRAMNMTQQQFADLAGVGRRFLVELEKGKKSLEIDRVLTVCQAAGIRMRFA